MPKFVPGADCVLYLPGQDDAYSATVRDRSGNGNNGTITGPTWTRLPSGLWVLDFDGSDDKVVSTSYFGDVNFKTTAFSVEWWANSTGGTYDGIFLLKPTTATNFAFELNYTSTTILGTTFIRADDDATGRVILKVGSLTFGSWQHYLITYDGTGTPDNTTLLMYLNGDALTKSASTGSSVVSGQPNNSITFGKYGVDSAFVGSMALFRVYNSVVSGHYQQERNLFGV